MLLDFARALQIYGLWDLCGSKLVSTLQGLPDEAGPLVIVFGIEGLCLVHLVDCVAEPLAEL